MGQAGRGVMRIQLRTAGLAVALSLVMTLGWVMASPSAMAGVSVEVNPHHGPQGTSVTVAGSFLIHADVRVVFRDADGVRTGEGHAIIDPQSCRGLHCTYSKTFNIPTSAAIGVGFVRMVSPGPTLSQSGRAPFTVTAS